MEEKILGVLGGLGPLATIYFADLVIKMTDADIDQEHIDMMILNHPSIPDRTAYILNPLSPNPIPYMVDDAQRLEKNGCDYIVIPCNTAHYFYDEIQKNVNVPIINIIEETVKYCEREIPNLKKIGILATEGTIASRAYQNIVEKHGYECVLPSEYDLRSLMNIIYNGVKAGQKVDIYEFQRIIGEMKKQGSDAIVLGCTELSIIKRDFDIDRSDVVDSMECLARASILACGKKLKN